MNELAVRPPAESAAWLAEFHAMTTEELKQNLAETLGLTARSLLRCACLIHVLERERSEDLSGLRIGILPHLRRIATGQLLPEVVVRFAGKPSLIAVVGNLPLDDQRRLAAGDSVALIVYADGGGRTVRMMDPLNMTPRQVSQAFARDHIRHETEQHAILDDRREKAARPIPESVGKLRIDKERGGVMVGRHFVPLADLVQAVQFLQ